MESLTTHQRAALQIARADGKIATAEQLAEFRMAKKEDGSPLWPRYMDGSDKERLSWLGDQFFGLAVLSHITLSSATVTVDTVTMLYGGRTGEALLNFVLNPCVCIFGAFAGRYVALLL